MEGWLVTIGSCMIFLSILIIQEAELFLLLILGMRLLWI